MNSRLSYLRGKYNENGEIKKLHDSHGIVQIDATNIPFENYVGKALQGKRQKYHIKPRCWDDGDLVVFPAVSHDGEVFEAQFFKKSPLPRKLYLSRKRRIQRLKRSANFMDELNQEDVRILVSRVSQGSNKICQKWTCSIISQ